MGKKDFSRTVYQPVKSQLAAAGKELTIKISHFSDRFDATKDFAGVIVYHWEGKVEWYNNKIDHRGRSFYVYLVCTESFREDEFREAGQGRVHHTAVERIMGIDFRENKACLGGFSVRNGVTNYSSVWLNEKTNTSFALPWESDGSKYLSEGEKLIVDFAVSEWKARGTNSVSSIPPAIDGRLSGGGPHIPRPSPVPGPFVPPGREPAGTVPIGSWRECSEGERVRVLPADQAEGPTRRSSANWTSDCRAHCDQEATITRVDSDGTLKLLFDDGDTLWFATGSCVKVTGHPTKRSTPHGGEAHRRSASRSSPNYSTNAGPFRHPGSWTGCGGNPNGTARSSGSGNCSGGCRNCGASTHWTCCASTDASSKHCRPGISEEQAERNARLCRGGSALSPSRSSSPGGGREALGHLLGGHLLGGHLLGMLHQGLVEHLQDAQARARPRSNGVGGIPVGAWVRVKPSVQSPEFGWGGISHQSVGRVEVVDGDILRIRIPGRPNRWNGRVHEMELAPDQEGPTVPAGMVAGAWVRVKPSVQSPRYEWGGVSRGSVGCVRQVDSDGDVWISFQEAKNWHGRAEEMEVVHNYRGPQESGGFRVGARVRLQNGVRPRYGQGGVSSGSVGTVKSITPDGDLHIDFPEQRGWHGHPADLQHA